MPASNEIQAVLSKAREFHYGTYAGGKAPGRHVADSAIDTVLYDSLRNASNPLRAGRAAAAEARTLWQTDGDQMLADRVNALYKDKTQQSELAGLVQFEDMYTPDRVRNAKFEAVSRYVQTMIAPKTPIKDNFYSTVRADPGESLAQTKEFVRTIETLTSWEYFKIDPQRGDIPRVSTGMAQDTDRINVSMQMYGAKVEYENKLYRVLPNVHTAELFAMLTIGWSGASARQREYDASKFLTERIEPEIVMSNTKAPNTTPLGQFSGVGITGYPNGTFSVDNDLPRIYHHITSILGLSIGNLKMLLPQNAWPVMNTRKGYRRLLGVDNSPLFVQPQVQKAPTAALSENGAYGLRNHAGVGFATPGAAASYLVGSREYSAAKAAEGGIAGPNPFLPADLPNWNNVYTLPSTGFGPMTVVLTQHAHADTRYYPTGHDLRNDDITGNPRPITVTDALIVDGNHPFHFIESIPPTSWTASNDEWQKSSVMMAEAFALADTVRGQQAFKLEALVLDHDWLHDLTLEADKLKITDSPAGAAGLAIS